MKTSLSSVMADILADGLEQSALPSVDYGSIREKMHAQLERRSRTAIDLLNESAELAGFKNMSDWYTEDLAKFGSRERERLFLIALLTFPWSARAHDCSPPYDASAESQVDGEVAGVSLISTSAYAYNRCGLRPITLPPIGCQNAVQVCTCDYNGNCSWAWQCGGY
jgi:hypothetical protein